MRLHIPDAHLKTSFNVSIFGPDMDQKGRSDQHSSNQKEYIRRLRGMRCAQCRIWMPNGVAVDHSDGRCGKRNIYTHPHVSCGGVLRGSQTSIHWTPIERDEKGGCSADQANVAGSTFRGLRRHPVIHAPPIYAYTRCHISGQRRCASQRYVGLTTDVPPGLSSLWSDEHVRNRHQTEKAMASRRQVHTAQYHPEFQRRYPKMM